MSVTPRSSRRRPLVAAPSAADLVEVLEQPVCGELDRLVAPLRGPKDARDERSSMDALQVSVDESVASLRAVLGAVGQTEVPRRVFVPRMCLEECVLVVGGRRGLAPVTVEDVLLGVDQLPRMRHGLLVHRVRGHRASPYWTLRIVFASDQCFSKP